MIKSYKDWLNFVENDFHLLENFKYNSHIRSNDIEKICIYLHKNKREENVHSIEDFDIFIRENEMVQEKSLIISDSGNLGLNFIQNNPYLYSIDFFNKEDAQSIVTMYIKKGREHVEIMLPLIYNLMLNPRLMTRKEVSEIMYPGVYENDNFINESKKKEEKVEVEIKKPKPEIEIKSDNDKYEYGDPKVLFKDLNRYVNMIINKKQTSLLITGSPGVGKTYEITSQLRDAGVDFEHVKGRSTPAGLYISLYQNRDKIIVIDDCDSVFKNEDAISILKSALDSYEIREISWLVGRPIRSPDGEQIPTKFNFSGSVIFISNLPQSRIDYAIKSRSFVLEVALSPEDMLIRMEEELPNIERQIPFALRKFALRQIRSIYRSAAHTGEENIELSMRTLIKAIKIVVELSPDISEIKRLIMQQCTYR